MLYIDLDDVTFDFTGYVNNALGTNYNVGELMTDADWAELRQDHQYMFLDLEPNVEFIPIFQSIIESINPADIAFLSALPCDDRSCWQFAALHKVRSVDNYLAKYGQSVPIPLFFGPYAHDKHKHCEVGDLLIDDKRSNCEEWVAAGGIAHIYRNPEGCIAFLEDNIAHFKI